MPPAEKKPKKTKAERLAEKQAIEAEKQRLAELERKRIEEENERLRLEAIEQQLRRNELRKIELDHLQKEYESFQSEQIEKRNASYEKEEKEEIEAKQWECFKEAKEESIAENEKEMNAFLTSLHEQEADNMKLPEVFQLVKYIYNISTDVYIALTECISKPIFSSFKSDEMEIKEDDRKIKNILKIDLFHSYLSQLYHHILMKLDKALFSLLRYAERYINDKNEIILQHIDAGVTIGLYTCYNAYHVHHKRINFEQLGITLEIPKEVMGKQPEPEQDEDGSNNNENVMSNNHSKHHNHNNRSSKALVFRVIQMKIDKYSQYYTDRTQPTTSNSTSVNAFQDHSVSDTPNFVSEMMNTGNINQISSNPSSSSSSTTRGNSSLDDDNNPRNNTNNSNKTNNDDNSDNSYYSIGDYYHIDIFDSPPLAVTLTHSTAASGSGANGSKWIVRDLSIPKNNHSYNNNKKDIIHTKNQSTTTNISTTSSAITSTITNNQFHYPYPDKPLRVTIQLPKTLIILTSEITIGKWDEMNHRWNIDFETTGLSRFEYDRMEHRISFDVVKTGVFALIRSRFADFPYLSWQLSPALMKAGIDDGNSSGDKKKKKNDDNDLDKLFDISTNTTNNNNNNSNTVGNNKPLSHNKMKTKANTLKGKICRFEIESAIGATLGLEFQSNLCKLISVMASISNGMTITNDDTTSFNNTNELNTVLNSKNEIDIPTTTTTITTSTTDTNSNSSNNTTNSLLHALSDLMHVHMRPGLLLHVLRRRGLNLIAPVDNFDIVAMCDITPKECTLEQNALLSLSRCALGCRVVSNRDWNKQLPSTQIGLVYIPLNDDDDDDDIHTFSTTTTAVSNDDKIDNDDTLNNEINNNTNNNKKHNKNRKELDVEIFILAEVDRVSSSFMGAPTVGLMATASSGGGGDNSSNNNSSSSSSSNDSDDIKYTLVEGDESKLVMNIPINQEDNTTNNTTNITNVTAVIMDDDEIKKKSGKIKSAATTTNSKKPSTATGPAATSKKDPTVATPPVAAAVTAVADVMTTLVTSTKSLSLNDDNNNNNIDVTDNTATIAISPLLPLPPPVVVKPVITYSIKPLENHLPHIDSSLALLSSTTVLSNNTNNNSNNYKRDAKENDMIPDVSTSISEEYTMINTVTAEAIQNVHSERVCRTVFELLRLIRPISLCQIPTPKPLPIIVLPVPTIDSSLLDNQIEGEEKEGEIKEIEGDELYSEPIESNGIEGRNTTTTLVDGNNTSDTNDNTITNTLTTTPADVVMNE